MHEDQRRGFGSGEGKASLPRLRLGVSGGRGGGIAVAF